MFRGTRKYWMIALIFGLLAAGGFYRYLQEIKTHYSPKDLVQVVRARENIPKDTIINVNAVQVDTLPAQYVHPDAVRDKSAVVGKVATSNITAGEEILQQKLLSSNDTEKRLAYAIPESKRAISVAVDSVSGVSGHVQVGDRVDVMATLDIPQGEVVGKSNIEACTVLALQNIEVLAIGENAIDNSAKKGEIQAKTMTLAVSVEEAQRLVLATERGTIRLLLRSPIEKGPSTPTPFLLKDFMK
ncbi:MAG TPA: Flp pilus assembly protein CpaB [Syntrophomonadaceae bacterium]|nr:Flp pilus assembly protein CpaB [Syntrophomonadaceae bacterium]